MPNCKPINSDFSQASQEMEGEGWAPTLLQELIIFLATVY